MGYDSDGIEDLIYTEMYKFISITPEKIIKNISRDGLNSSILINNVKVISNIIIRSNLLIFINNINNNNSGGGIIYGYNLKNNELILKEDNDLYLSLDINDDLEIIAIDIKYNINVFKFAD